VNGTHQSDPFELYLYKIRHGERWRDFFLDRCGDAVGGLADLRNVGFAVRSSGGGGGRVVRTVRRGGGESPLRRRRR